MNEPPVLKPMTVVQILDASFRVYRENFFLFLGIMAIPYVPVTIFAMIANGILFASLPPHMRDRQARPFQSLQYSGPAEGTSEEMGNVALVMGTYLAFVVAALIIFLIAIPIAKGALTRAVSDRYLGRPATLGASYRAVFSIFWRFLGTSMLVGLVLGVSFLCFCIPFLFMFVFFAFVSQIMILEGQAGTNAMGRSMDLSKGHRWRILGLGVLTVLVNWILGCVSGALFQFVLPYVVDSPTLLALLNTASGNLIQMVIEPLWAVAWILLYYDVRIRKEAFDLQILATRVS